MRAQQESDDIVEASREIQDIAIDDKESLQKKSAEAGADRLLNEELLEMHSQLSPNTHPSMKSRQSDLAKPTLEEVRHSGQSQAPNGARVLKEQRIIENRQFEYQI